MLSRNYKLLIVEDHPFYLKGIKSHISDNYGNISVSCAENGTSTLKKLNETFFDLAIIDLGLPDIDGIELIKRTRKRSPGTKIIVNSYEYFDYQLSCLIKCNVESILSKCDEMELIDQAIECLLKDEKFYSPDWIDLIHQLESESRDKAFKELTESEIEILKLLCEGHTSEEIATIRNISLNTVNTHKKNIFTKLGVHNTAELGVQAAKMGLI